MDANLSIPWKKIYDFVLSCGNTHDVKSFSMKVLSDMRELCDFDQSLVYYLDGNRKVCNQYLVNIDKKWSNMYLEYYYKTDNGRYSLVKDVRENSTKTNIYIKSWEAETSSEFVPDYIRSRGIKYSLGFALYDINGMPRTIFAFDKTKNENFTEDEYNALSLAVPQLNNLHKKFFCQQTSRQGIDEISWETTDLTPREIEIANLLCQGISPTIISTNLHISKSTTYKHISNIYQKINVSSQQELLVRMLG